MNMSFGELSDQFTPVLFFMVLVELKRLFGEHFIYSNYASAL